MTSKKHFARGAYTAYVGQTVEMRRRWWHIYKACDKHFAIFAKQILQRETGSDDMRTTAGCVNSNWTSRMYMCVVSGGCGRRMRCPLTVSFCALFVLCAVYAISVMWQCRVVWVCCVRSVLFIACARQLCVLRVLCVMCAASIACVRECCVCFELCVVCFPGCLRCVLGGCSVHPSISGVYVVFVECVLCVMCLSHAAHKTIHPRNRTHTVVCIVHVVCRYVLSCELCCVVCVAFCRMCVLCPRVLCIVCSLGVVCVSRVFEGVVCVCPCSVCCLRCVSCMQRMYSVGGLACLHCMLYVCCLLCVFRGVLCVHAGMLSVLRVHFGCCARCVCCVGYES